MREISTLDLRSNDADAMKTRGKKSLRENGEIIWKQQNYTEKKKRKTRKNKDQTI